MFQALNSSTCPATIASGGLESEFSFSWTNSYVVVLQALNSSTCPVVLNLHVASGGLES